MSQLGALDRVMNFSHPPSLPFTFANFHPWKFMTEIPKRSCSSRRHKLPATSACLNQNRSLVFPQSRGWAARAGIRALAIGKNLVAREPRAPKTTPRPKLDRPKTTLRPKLDHPKRTHRQKLGRAKTQGPENDTSAKIGSPENDASAKIGSPENDTSTKIGSPENDASAKIGSPDNDTRRHRNR